MRRAFLRSAACAAFVAGLCAAPCGLQAQTEDGPAPLSISGNAALLWQLSDGFMHPCA